MHMKFDDYSASPASLGTVVVVEDEAFRFDQVRVAVSLVIGSYDGVPNPGSS
jgi:fumarylacetoacetate (FAA) hydrolase family protein